LPAHDTVEELGNDKRELFVGVDIGRLHDLTVVWVLALDGDALVTAAIFELSNAPFREQFELLSEVMSIANVRRCCIDAGGLGMQLAEQAVERFGGHRVEALTFTPTLKSQLASGLRLSVEATRIRIPTVTPSGHFRLAAPRRADGHADRFWAAALAIHAVGAGGGVIEALSTERLRFARSGVW
jgi:phage FluMu gp28-like protein